MESPVITYISDSLSEFFVVTNFPYEGATDFNKEHPLLTAFSKNPIKMTFRIHETIMNGVRERFGLYPKKIGESRLEIDLWDDEHGIAYEIVLGNGEEIWKDILKAILVGAKKLVVFCGNHPDAYIKGCMEIVNAVSNLEPFLKEKIDVKIVFIQPI